MTSIDNENIINVSTDASDHIFTIEKKTSLENSTVDYETAIKLCGYGRFHYGFTILCGIIFLFGGCQSSVNAYIIPAAECDLKLNSKQKGMLHIAFLLGGLSSSLLWGILANAYGRKTIIVSTLLLDSIFTFISTMSQSFQALVIFRAIAGITIGAPGSLIYTYLGEFTAPKQRVKSICFVGFCWTLASFVLPGLAWIIIPLRFSYNFHGYLFNSWRLYLGIIGIPLFICGLLLMAYPESPKYLLSRGKKKEALMILQQIYAINTKQHKLNFPVQELKITSNEANNSTNITDENTFDDSSSCTIIQRLLKNAWKQIKTITSPPFRKYAILCWIVYFTNMYGWYGFGIWLPELFNRFENYYKLHPNGTAASVCKLITVNNNRIINALSDCDHWTINSNVFMQTLAINAASATGIIICGCVSNRLKRNTIPVLASLVAGIAGYVIYTVNSSTQIIIVTCIFCVMMASANIVITSVVIDIFPTHVNALAICLTSASGRIGAIVSNLAFGLLVDNNCEMLIFMIATIVIFGSLLCHLIPNEKPSEIFQ
ncbi:hypothetical protein PV327_000831 [Microctonus hyperodae]|uniref:Major facilitator superfamily (MFS) profile domain-containing protein n=1 Tax=Microctonus hyperodae TaxID=165561 RepID=A0AA39L2J7_MICHY|nr:hypothetical protein PV327_000831 [Microctonus hyperodae]